MIKKFETNKTYSCRSACDNDCVWKYKIVKRTKCFIWILVGEFKPQLSRRKITTRNGFETAQPLGPYSMAPVLRATEGK